MRPARVVALGAHPREHGRPVPRVHKRAGDRHLDTLAADRLLLELLGLLLGTQLPPLLERLSERAPERLEWLGVSYGLTPSLFRFWKHAGFVPLYMRQTPNELTGEYSTVQLKTIGAARGAAWLAAFARDFRRRFLSLLAFRFRELSTLTALSVVEAASGASDAPEHALSAADLAWLLTPFDMKRLESYGNNLLELQVVLDLLPTLATLYFAGRLRADADDEAPAPLLTVSGLSAALLLAVGLQRRTLDDAAGELQLPLSQAHTLLAKAVRYMVQNLRALERRSVAATLDAPAAHADAPPARMLFRISLRMSDRLAPGIAMNGGVSRDSFSLRERRVTYSAIVRVLHAAALLTQRRPRWTLCAYVKRAPCAGSARAAPVRGGGPVLRLSPHLDFLQLCLSSCSRPYVAARGGPLTPRLRSRTRPCSPATTPTCPRTSWPSARRRTRWTPART